jgi:hypothetical protein
VIPPGIVATANPDLLWPPNGRMEQVTVSGFTGDNPGGSGVNPSSLTFHVVDEYGQVQPSGAITNVHPRTDGGYDFSFHVNLQARRPGFDHDGRQYAIIVSDRDNAGNVGQGLAFVTVPHDMGHAPVFGFGPYVATNTTVNGVSPGMGSNEDTGAEGEGGNGHHGRHGRHGRDESFAGPQSSTSEPSSTNTVIVSVPGDGGEEGDQGNQGSGDNGNGNGNGRGHGH